MTDIRPIRPTEADDFLRLLCDVFRLDVNRAREVFFSEPLFDLQRKWGLFENGTLITILTTTPLEFGWGRAFGIAGVATRRDHRNQGYASTLLREVTRASGEAGETGALLFARVSSVYEKNGFRVLDEVVRSGLRLRPGEDTGESIETDLVRRLYDAWSLGHPDRLRRNLQRWTYWNWHYRLCAPYREGYLCSEPGVLREAIYTPGADALPLAAATEWFGLRSMAQLLQLPVTDARPELILMGRGFERPPQMFMTDQF